MARYAETKALESEVADLQERFETRKLVDRAKGLLQVSLGLSEPDAFRWLQKTAMDRRAPMREIARTVIEAGGAPVAQSGSTSGGASGGTTSGS